MTTEKIEINITGISESLSGHSVDAVSCGDFLFMSALPGLDRNLKIVGKGDVVAQTRQACENIRGVLEAAEMGFQDIVYFKVFLLDVNDRPKINPVRQEFFGTPRPGSTLIAVGELPFPDALILIEAVAYKPRSGGLPREEVRVPGLNEPLSHYTDVVRCGDFAWLSGTGSFDEDMNIVGPDDPVKQVERTMLNLQMGLEACGMSFADCVRVVLYLTDVSHRAEIAGVRQTFHGSHKPTATMIGVPALAVPGMLMEIEAIAYKPRDGGAPRTEIAFAKENPPAVPFTDAVMCGDILFLAGQPPIDGSFKLVGGDDVAAQSIQVYENLKAALEAAGMTYDDVVKVTEYFIDIDDLPKTEGVRSQYFGGNRVANSLVEVGDHALPRMLIEIDAIAYRLGSGA